MPPRRAAKPAAVRRAVLYLRQSAPRDESVSMAQQETACRDYCARHGYQVVAVEQDGITGQTWRKRPGVQRAMAMLEDRTADLVVLWKWSRLARRSLDFEVALDRARTVGGEIESATEPVDVATAAGRFQRGVLSQVAAFEAERIGEGWEETHARRRALGRPAQGGDRFGYRRVWNEQVRDYDYVIDDEQAGVLRWMYDRVIEGRGGTWIAAELNRRGAPHPRAGHLWAQHRVFPLLDSGFAAGLLVHHPRDGQRRIGDAVYHDGAHPPIISRRTWDEYLLARRARRSTPPRVIEPRYPLTGLIKCGDCGASMWSARSKYGGAGHSYVCGRWQQTREGRCVTVARHRAEQAVLDWLGEQARDIEAAADADNVVRNRLGRARRAARDAARVVAELDQKLERLNRAWLDGVVPDAGYAQTRDGLTAERDQAVAAADAAELAAHQRAAPTRATAVSLLDRWDELAVPVRRNLLQTLIARVVVHPPDVRGGRSRLVVVPIWEDDSG